MVFGSLHDVYDDDKLSHSEACLNVDAVFPSLKACKDLLRIRGHVVSLFPAEEELVSMTKVLAKEGLKDSRSRYNADGIMRATELKSSEILVLETSRALNAATADKKCFDHFKEMFGLLAILKTIASEYQFADFNIFKNLKIYYIHVHGT